MTLSASTGDPSRSAPATLVTVEATLQACWDEHTCDPVDLPWSSDNPSRGQCGATALVVNDLLGGDLMIAEVLFPDGSRQGWHTWNVFGDGLEVDLTREQFRADERIQPGERVTRPPGPPSREPERYELLRDRVRSHLSLDR